MLVRVGEKTYIATWFNGEVIELLDSGEWSYWMKSLQDYSTNTVTTFMAAMDRFWIWSLYNPVGFNEKFSSYQARYRKELMHGFEIRMPFEMDKEGDDGSEIVLLASTPKTKKTINKEIAGINSYFHYMEEDDLIYDHRYVNHLYERQRSAKGFLASVEIRKSQSALDTFGKKKQYLRPYKTVREKHRDKYLPLELFDELLDLAKDREKLVYLLCGACSARIGQALSLTMYDIDYEQHDIWLLDPESDYKDIYGNKRRRWLREQYGIDASDESSTHGKSDLKFKYPIPLYHEPLYWLNEDKYKALFFETLPAYTDSKYYLSEHVRHPKHPFLFVTQNGNRMHAREVNQRFKKAMIALERSFPRHSNLTDLSLHSLRHMFGHAMAELFIATGDESIPVITQQAMGHSSYESTLVYFRTSTKTVREILRNHSKKIFGGDS